SFLEHLVQSKQGLEGHFVRQPDMTLWFDLAPDIAAQRLAGARVPDKFEAQPVEFFARVRAGYQARFAAQPQRFARIDADQSRDAVWQDVFDTLLRKGWLHEGANP
ncbi:MAG: dTMP kinase, partial [Rhodoferax sp.]|nr:dTMP kinase [Rhodoferax sp.]